MKFRNFANSSKKVSEVGFGAWGIGGTHDGAISYGSTDDETSLKALRRAFEIGINFFDTSDQYGFGKSEELIGKAFEKDREKVFIASKVGWAKKDGQQDFSSSNIIASLEASLHRMRSHYINLYQLHCPSVDELFDNPEIMGTMEKLKKTGKINHIGVSLRSPQDGICILDKYNSISSLMVNFNMMDIRAHGLGLFSKAKERRVSLIIRTPLCFGFLTGSFDENTKYPEGDHRNLQKKEQIQSWVRGYRKIKNSIGKDSNMSDAQFAIKFCLSFSAVTCVIPGMLNGDHVEENARASNFEDLKEKTISEVMKMNSEIEFFVK